MHVFFTVDVILIIITTLLLLFPFALRLAFLLNSKRRQIAPAARETDIACVITAFKNIDLAILAVDSLLKQQYKRYHIYVVADACDLSVEIKPHPKLTVLIPDKVLGSKVRSMKYATDNFIRDHEAIAIFDPDNLADDRFLYECNRYLSNGYEAVQGKRIAKNLDSTIACLDAMGEIYYNFSTKKIPFSLGSSAIIAGSGMVVERQLFTDFFEEPYIKANFNNVIPGEDKILHYFIVSRGKQITYSEDAILYDEKINNAGMVKSQRARWINAYILNLKNATHLFLKGITSLNINKFISGTLTLYPPLFLLIILAASLFLVNMFYFPFFSKIIFSALLLFVLNFIWVLKINKAHPKIWAAFWGIPYFILNQLLSLFNIKKSNKDFLTTKNHKKISLEEVIKNS